MLHLFGYCPNRFCLPLPRSFLPDAFHLNYNSPPPKKKKTNGSVQIHGTLFKKVFSLVKVASLTERLVRSIRVEQSVVSSRSLPHTLGLPSLCLFLTHIHKLIPHISRSVFWGQFCKSSKLRVTWVRYVNFVKWTQVPNLLNHFRIRHVKIRRINAFHCYIFWIFLFLLFSWNFCFI